MDLCPLDVMVRPCTLNDRLHGAPAATVAVSSPLVRVPARSVADTVPWPASLPTRLKPTSSPSPWKCSILTPTMLGSGELSVTVRVGQLRAVSYTHLRAHE